MTQKITKDKVFLDFDLNFVAHPITGELKTLKNEAAIIQAVKNLVLMNKYEKLMNPNVFSGVTGLLFENFDITTSTLVKSRIESVVRNFEPRARVVRVDVTQRDDENGIDVAIFLQLNNRIDPVRVDIFLKKVR